MDERDPLQLGADVYESAGVLDINDRWETPSGSASGVPLALQLLQIAGAQYRSGAVDAQMSREFGALQEHIHQALEHPKVGFLVEVAIHRDESGNVHVPGGQLLYPVGVGIHPIDSLAESFRTPQLRNSSRPHAGFKDQTFYVWIMRGGSAGMTGWTIPAEFRPRLVEQAGKEARRRNLASAWTREWPDSTPRKIERAAYWSEVFEARAHLIESEARRSEILRINQAMKEHEHRANRLYAEFQSAVRSIVRAQSYAATLEGIATITQVFELGIKAGELMSRETGKPATGAGESPASSVPATAQHTTGTIREYERVRAESATGVKYEVERMREYDANLGRIYKDEGLPVPARDDIDVPELP